MERRKKDRISSQESKTAEPEYPISLTNVTSHPQEIRFSTLDYRKIKTSFLSQRLSIGCFQGPVEKRDNSD